MNEMKQKIEQIKNEQPAVRVSACPPQPEVGWEASLRELEAWLMVEELPLRAAALSQSQGSNLQPGTSHFVYRDLQ